MSVANSSRPASESILSTSDNARCCLEGPLTDGGLRYRGRARGGAGLRAARGARVLRSAGVEMNLSRVRGHY